MVHQLLAQQCFEQKEYKVHWMQSAEKVPANPCILDTWRFASGNIFLDSEIWLNPHTHPLLLDRLLPSMAPVPSWKRL